MPKMLRSTVVFLFFKIDWKKLFLVFSVFTIGSILILVSSLPLPFTAWISRPCPTIWSRKPWNTALHLGKTQSLLLDAQLETVTAPLAVPLNSSTKPYRPTIVSNRERKASRRRRRSTRKAASLVSPPSAPLIVKKLPSHLERDLSSLTPDEALAYARKDIENASIASVDDPELYAPLFRNLSTFKRYITLCFHKHHCSLYPALAYARKDIENALIASVDDPELYAPLFRNLSTFKRSYEWMEWMLKVYIYQEGEKPIFHVPHLYGIYSSEGWFMKLMEENRQFVTKDPAKANLFYLPYSTRQLQLALYVQNSHNLKPLAVFLRDYVNMLAAKYPFWNRTHGSDHFLVACHDWGPYLLKEHEELIRNTIKALCNADVSERIFIPWKDVSLPETTIRNPKRPLRNVGGKRVSERPILAFFAGRRHGRVRPILLNHWSDKDEDMRIYGPLPNRASRVMSYPEHMKSSRYCICPMGYEVNSPRIVEAIYYECVPVIIADNFAPPLSDVLNWDAFSVTVAEKDIPRLKELLLAIPMKQYLTMQANVKMVQKHFLWNANPVRYDLFHMILHSIWASRLNQIQMPLKM